MCNIIISTDFYTNAILGSMLTSLSLGFGIINELITFKGSNFCPCFIKIETVCAGAFSTRSEENV